MGVGRGDGWRISMGLLSHVSTLIPVKKLIEQIKFHVSTWLLSYRHLRANKEPTYYSWLTLVTYKSHVTKSREIELVKLKLK